MAKPLPVGFSNWRTFFFVNNVIANNFYAKASFSRIVSDVIHLYRGPSIASTSAANPVVITTAEAHGFKVGQTVSIDGMPNALSALNAEWVITAVGSPTTFSVGFNSTTPGTSTGYGMAGVDIGVAAPTASFSLMPGALCVDDYPAAHELPWEG